MIPYSSSFRVNPRYKQIQMINIRVPVVLMNDPVFIFIPMDKAKPMGLIFEEPAYAHRARASCLPDSNPYGRDGLAHSRSLPTARRALRVA